MDTVVVSITMERERERERERQLCSLEERFAEKKI
jgi:hypothetical protein